MSPIDTFALLTLLLLIKHYIADLPLQTGWMVAHKGIFLHPGGLIHAGIHAIGSLLVLVPAALLGKTFAVDVVIFLVAVEFAAHYLIDFGKVNIDAQLRAYRPMYEDTGYKHGLKFEGSVYKGTLIAKVAFYYSFVGDQMLHVITNLAMVWYLLR